MVKIHCDRCGKEIKDRYYTINIYGNDVDPISYFEITDTAFSANSYSNSRESVLHMLNSTKMYCKDCKDAVERFIDKR